MTLDEFESWLEEQEGMFWEIARQPEATTRERGMWHGVNHVLLMWEKVQRDS